MPDLSVNTIGLARPFQNHLFNNVLHFYAKIKHNSFRTFLQFQIIQTFSGFFSGSIVGIFFRDNEYKQDNFVPSAIALVDMFLYLDRIFSMKLCSRLINFYVIKVHLKINRERERVLKLDSRRFEVKTSSLITLSSNFRILVSIIFIF